MMKRWITLCVSALLAAILLVGCASGGLLATILTLIEAGDAITRVDDIIGGDDPETVTVLLDGQVLPVAPKANGDLELSGLPEGRHLLQVNADNHFRGSVSVINVQGDARVTIPAQTAVVGGRIIGTVLLGTTPARRVLVVAIPGGAADLQKSKGVPISIPPVGTYYAAFTDANGDYSLDAVGIGDYLVTTAVAGYTTDVKLLNIPEQRRTLRADLTLDRDTASPSGTFTGGVTGAIVGGSQSLANTRITATRGVPFAPVVPQTVIDIIAGASGMNLGDSPWFSWAELATLSDVGGGYQMRGAPGSVRLDCFAYAFKPGFRNVQLINGGNTYAAFDLVPR